MAIVKIPEEQLDLTNTNTAIAAKMPLAGGTFTGDITMAQGKSVKFQNSQIVENGAGNPIIGDGNGNGLVVAADGGGAALFTNNGGSYTELVTQNDVKSTYSSSGTDPVNGTAVASAISSKQDNLSAAQLNAANSGITAAKVTSYDSHIVNTSNPHSVTKAQVGLGNVNNTSDADKPISTATMQALTEVGYSEWQKPSDWIDIRSGALPNSVYFLVGHSADYATYPTFTVLAGVSNSGTYDVFVDGIKQATTASATETTLNWQTLALTSGYDVTYPAALKTHVVRVTPTLDSDTLASIRTDFDVVKGVMWAHFTLTNAISLYTFLSNTGNVYNDRAPLFEALTTLTNEIKVTFMSGAFNCIKNIKTLPVFVGKGNSYANRVGTNNTFTRSGIKRIHFKDFWVGDPFGLFRGCNKLESIELENSSIGSDSYMFDDCYKLKRLPDPWTVNWLAINAITNAAALEPTVLDLSQKTTLTRVDVRGSSTYPMKGLKGITVSNEAPFNSTTSPQINVSYTGLDRSALVNLFKSMPYNVGYTVVGSPTISSGVASGFSSDDYLPTSLALPQLLSNFEIVAKVKWGNTTLSDYQMIIGSTYLGFMITAYKTHIKIYASTTGTSWNFVSGESGEHTFEENDVIWIKAVKDSTSLKIYYSTDNQNWVLDNSFEVTDPIKIRNNYSLCGIGSNTAKYFTGSIYLNDTYININGVPWFTGKAAMTKTCSIVGCTGTADLTQDDKDIALNKGWELTVA